VALPAPPIPISAPRRNEAATVAPKRETKYASQGFAALLLAAICPMIWSPLVLASVGLVTAAFVLAIMAIVKGKTTAGIILIVACPFALIFAFASIGAMDEARRIRSEQKR
jgi:hypothetical protein